MKILIGTQNRAKQQDFSRSITHSAHLIHFPIELLYPQDFDIEHDVEETGETFEENSELKARYYFEKTQIPTISDDGGIIIPALGENIPGVHSKRWAGDQATDQEIIEHTLKTLEPFRDSESRKTVFRTCLTYFDGAQIIQATGETMGHMSLVPLGNNGTKGFPYRRLFILPNGKYYDQLTAEEHEKYNHRDQAVRKLLQELKNIPQNY